MDHAILQIAMRYLHILSAIIIVGGMIFISIALKPALRLLDDDRRQSFQDVLHRRFHRVVYLCFAGLLISGAYNWIRLAPAYHEMGPKGNAVIGVKVLLAAIAFVLIWGRSIGLIRLPDKACHLINLHLMAIIILLAGLLRYWRLAL